MTVQDNKGLQRIRENAWVGYNRLREELILALKQNNKEEITKIEEMIKEWQQSIVDSKHPWLYSEEFLHEMKRGLFLV